MLEWADLAAWMIREGALVGLERAAEWPEQRYILGARYRGSTIEAPVVDCFLHNTDLFPPNTRRL